MSGKGSVENRRHARAGAEDEINVVIAQGPEGGGTESRIPAQLSNVSVTGVCFMCQREFFLGSIVKLELSIRSRGEPVQLDGRVEWCEALVEEPGEGLFRTGANVFATDWRDETDYLEYVFGKLADSPRGAGGS